MSKRKEIYPCPNCQGLNTYKSGKNAAKTQMIYCRDCDQQLTLRPPDVSTINCLICGKLGIRHRKPCLCSDCYQRKYYNRKQIEEAFDFKYPDNFDIEEYLNKISTQYISKRANVKKDILLYLTRLEKLSKI